MSPPWCGARWVLPERRVDACQAAQARGQGGRRVRRAAAASAQAAARRLCPPSPPRPPDGAAVPPHSSPTRCCSPSHAASFLAHALLLPEPRRGRLVRRPRRGAEGGDGRGNGQRWRQRAAAAIRPAAVTAAATVGGGEGGSSRAGGRGHTCGGANGYRGSSNAGGDGGHGGRQRWQQRLAPSTRGDDGKSATDSTDRKTHRQTHDPSLSSSNLPIAFYFLLQLFIRCSRTKGSNEAGFCWVSLRFLKISPESKVSVFNGGDGKWIGDSDVITQVIKEKFPTPSLVTPPEYAPVVPTSTGRMYQLLILAWVKALPPPGHTGAFQGLEDPRKPDQRPCLHQGSFQCRAGILHQIFKMLLLTKHRSIFALHTLPPSAADSMDKVPKCLLNFKSSSMTTPPCQEICFVEVTKAMIEGRAQQCYCGQFNI